MQVFNKFDMQVSTLIAVGIFYFGLAICEMDLSKYGVTPSTEKSAIDRYREGNLKAARTYLILKSLFLKLYNITWRY